MNMPFDQRISLFNIPDQPGMQSETVSKINKKEGRQGGREEGREVYPQEIIEC